MRASRHDCNGDRHGEDDVRRGRLDEDDAEESEAKGHHRRVADERQPEQCEKSDPAENDERQRRGLGASAMARAPPSRKATANQAASAPERQAAPAVGRGS